MNLRPLRLLLLLAIGCPGGKESVLLCEDPQTILLTNGSNSGFERCADGAVNRVRAQPVDPTNSGRACAGDEEQLFCSTDAECTEGTHGACISDSQAWDGPVITYCDCEYACASDADCEVGEVCVPDELSPYTTRAVCAPARCQGPEDCSSQECGLSIYHEGCGWIMQTLCREDADTCHADLDCKETCAVDFESSRFECLETECSVGRPLLVEGEARVARLVPRNDWKTATAVPLPSPEKCGELATLWGRIGALEHASVGSFARFTLQLLALGAPAELLAGVQVAASDEIRHARFAYGLASTFSGVPQGPGPLPLDQAGPSYAPEGVLQGLIDEACIGETLGAAELRAAAELADPALRGTLLQMAEEEAQHAALAWKSLNWLLQQHPGLREPARSAALPMIPSRASISRTRCPLPSPPMAGLQDITPMLSRRRVTRATLTPRRAAACAASTPAWPPPMTTTSECFT